MKLKNKSVLVTGGTSGIGVAAALLFAKEGARVVVAGRREAEGKAVVEAIEARGGSAAFCKTDVSREEEVKTLVEFVLARHGGLDIAFNNGGIEGEPGLTIDRQTVENYRQTFDINVLGVLLSMKHEIPAMLMRGGGAIVNTSSVVGQVGLAGLGVYAASKHAVNGLTRSAALEFAKQGIRVNAIAPAAIETPMLQRLVGGESEVTPQREGMASLHPVGRIGTPQEVAQAVLALCLNEFITGVILPVDGGFTAQ